MTALRFSVLGTQEDTGVSMLWYKRGTNLFFFFPPQFKDKSGQLFIIYSQRIETWTLGIIMFFP